MTTLPGRLIKNPVPARPTPAAAAASPGHRISTTRQKKKVFPKGGALVRPKAGPAAAAGAAFLGRAAGADRRLTVLGICIFLAAAVWLVFGQTLHFGFTNYDDNLYVYDNPLIVHGLSWRGLGWIFTHSVSFNWHPLTMLSLMLDGQCYGLKAGGYHLTNVLLHTASVVLLFLALRDLTGALWRSAFVAAVFAVHPLHVESVAWVAERKDVLSGVFFMLTLWAYLYYVRQPSWRRYLLVLLAFALGLLSKPMLVTVPFVLLLLDYWPLQRFEPARCMIPWRLIREKIPLLLLAAGFCVLTLFMQAGARCPALPLSQRLANSLAAYVIYLGQLFWPAGLAAHYPYSGPGLPPVEIMAAALLLATISTAAWLARRKHPGLLVGWLWYVGMSVPVIGLVQVGDQPHADRYTYLPQIGLYIMIAWLPARPPGPWHLNRRVVAGLSGVIVGTLIICARAQAAYWQDSETLWTHTLACTSDNEVAENNLGNALVSAGQPDAAIPHLQRALAILPDDAQADYNLGYALLQKGQLDEAMVPLQKAEAISPAWADPYNILGNFFLQHGRVDEAIAQYQMAIKIQPGYAEAHNNLGTVLFQTGRVDQAMAQYQKAIDIQPDLAEAHSNLSRTMLQKREVNAAIIQAREALKIRPDFAKARRNLGVALVQKGQVDEGVSQLQQALALQPDLWDAQSDLTQIAWIMATAPAASARNGSKALELALQTDRLSGGTNSVMAATLAAAYAETGQFPAAITTARRALQLASGQNNAALAVALASQLKLYEAGSPFHDSPKSP